MPDFYLLKKELRQLESDCSVVPAGIKKKKIQGQEQWEISFDKLMLYQFDPHNPDKYIFEAETKPNYNLHAASIKKVLERDFPQGVVNVTVTPQFKVLPIPFINIPIKIPFTNIGWRKAPNKVRGNDSLGTIPVEVKVKLTPTESMNAQSLWNSLNKVACLHTKNASTLDDQIDAISIDTSGSASKNPFRYVMMHMTSLCRKIFPTKFWQAMPHMKSNRPYPYGYPIASHVLNAPLINSGVGAHMANAAVIGGPIVLCTACFVGCLCVEAKAGNKSNESSAGFMLGMLKGSSHSSGTDVLIGSVLAGSRSHLLSGYGNGLLFSQTLNSGVELIGSAASAAADPSCHAPFATRTVIYSKI